MSDTVTNLVGNTEPRNAAATGFQNAKVPLSDLFANVLDKTTFADRMLPQTDLGLARAAERDHDADQEIYNDDQDHADAAPADDASSDVRDDDDRNQDGDDAEAEGQTDDQPQDDGANDAQQFAATSTEDALLDLNAAANEAQKAGLIVQPNAASGVVLKSKTEGDMTGQTRVMANRGEAQAAAQTAANADKANALGQDTAARANAALLNSQASARGQQADGAAAKAGASADGAAAEKAETTKTPAMTQTQNTALGDDDGLGASLEKHAMLIRAGAERAAELHNMKIRVMAHRAEIKEAIAQSANNNNGTQAPANGSSANKPSIEITTSAMPPAPAAHDGPATRPTTLFNSPATGALPGQAGVNGQTTMAIGDTVGNGSEQSITAADRQAMTTNTTRGLNMRPLPPQQAYQPAEQVKVHIQQLVKSDADRIQVKLSPASLGKVEVTLEVSPDKAVQAIVYAEKPETLDMLERDARVLQRAFEEAGMKLDQDSLMFKHGQSGDPETELADGSPSSETDGTADGDGSDETDANAAEPASRRSHDGMLDLEI
ncbi:MAG: hypothetical protein GKS02_03600 [Alphaproteobacteria bacterium]|nr:hypothetical protein [Alphaproteobacteria bacterium]